MKHVLIMLAGLSAVIIVSIPVTMIALFLGFSNGGASFLAGWCSCLLFKAIEGWAERRLA